MRHPVSVTTFPVARGLFAPRVRGGPQLTIDASGLTYSYPALLKQPMTIGRDTVHSVWVRPFPWLRASSRKSPRWSREWLAGNGRYVNWPIDQWYAPDLGGRPTYQSRNLLVVFNEPVAFNGYVRRTRSFGHFFLGGRGYLPTFPSNWTRARGWWAQVDDVTALRTALCGWPTASAIPPDVLAWLHRPGTAPSCPPQASEVL